jgi:hypothetical protein
VSDEREEVAEELRRLAEEAQRRARRTGGVGGQPPSPPVLRETPPFRGRPSPPAAPLPSPPDPAAVNAAWRAEPPPSRGIRRLLHRLLERLLRPHFDAQQTFNARQVQLDNELVVYLGERLEATHRHYDHVLGLYGRHIDEIDERHIILQEELVSHVHDLVKRIDFVLAEAERGQLSREAVLEDLRRRIARLEETLKRRA